MKIDIKPLQFELPDYIKIQKKPIPVESETSEEEEFKEEEPEPKSTVAAFGDPDLIGISEEQLDLQCDQLFAIVPISFKARQDNQIDIMIESMIYDFNISIPIVHIKAKLYLIGVQRVSLEIKRTSVLARIGGGYQDLT